MTSTSDSHLVTAAEAARILGVTRGRVVELAASTVGFPAFESMFVDAEGRTFRYGVALRQYFIDRDGHPVLTADGRPVDMLVNEHGDEVRDAEGRRIGPVEIPPGCRVKARHERD